MFTRYALLLALLCATGVQAQNLIITGILDGGLPGGLPKALELYVVNDIADLSVYNVDNANNGNAFDGTTIALSGSATAGSFLYVASEEPGFTSYFGFAPNFTGNSLNVNGDDVVGLFQGTTLVDVFGVLGVDGTGEPWEYLDGWAYRVSGTTANGTFVLANYTYSGIDVTDNTTTAAQTGFPVGTYSSGPPANVTVTQDAANVAGFRLLSTPVTGVTVTTLAGLNLVQGIPAGTPATTFPAQYPGGTEAVASNLLTAYTGTGYTRPATTGFAILPGRGFFWNLYNQNIPASNISNARFGPGTSASVTLAGTTDLSATGPALTTTVTRTFDLSTNNFYMIGNPFARPLSASAITVPGGIQGNVVQAYRPNPAGYVPIAQTGTTGQTALAVWQGVFAETITAAAPTFTFDATVATPTAPPFYGRSVAEASVALTLAGQTASGTETLDEASIVRFADGASAGWDVLDASKLTPPGGSYALVSPLVTRDGAPYRTAISTLPLTSATVGLSFLATDAGTYTLSADAASLPDGVTAELRDVVTGETGQELTFTTDATDWTNRFELVLAQRGTVAGESAPAALSLSAPAPNPTTRRSTLALTVDAAQHVTATVVDALGRTVATVYDADMAAGAQAQIAVDASALAPGVYVVRVAGETFAETRRITVAR